MHILPYILVATLRTSSPLFAIITTFCVPGCFHGRFCSAYLNGSGNGNGHGHAAHRTRLASTQIPILTTAFVRPHLQFNSYFAGRKCSGHEYAEISAKCSHNGRRKFVSLATIIIIVVAIICIVDRK